MTSRTPRERADAAPSTPDLDSQLAQAEAQAVVVWRGRRVAFADLSVRVAAIADRTDRNQLFAGYIEAVEALNPLRADRLAARNAAALRPVLEPLLYDAARRRQMAEAARKLGKPDAASGRIGCPQAWLRPIAATSAKRPGQTCDGRMTVLPLWYRKACCPVSG